MGYLYLAKYDRFNQRFELPASPGPAGDDFAPILFRSLSTYNQSTSSCSIGEYIYFYLAYYPMSDFLTSKAKCTFFQNVGVYNNYMKDEIMARWDRGNDRLITDSFDSHSFADKQKIDEYLARLDKQTDKYLFRDITAGRCLPCLPIIHITETDLLAEIKISDAGGWDESRTGKQDTNHSRTSRGLSKMFYLPRYIRIIDNGIWNMHIPLREYGGEGDHTLSETDFHNRLRNTIEKIESKLNYYTLQIARENVDFNARLMFSSFLAGNGGHSRAIAPFLFHSEKRMNELLKEQVEDNRKIFSRSPRWSVLVVDDHYKETMSGSQSITKEHIITELLREVCYEVKSTRDLEEIFDVCFAPDIETARMKLVGNRYDIILLDYLLFHKPAKGEHKKKAAKEYSFTLLQDIHIQFKDKSNERGYKKGTFGHFYFFHISSFSHAIRERLQEMGLPYSTDYWQIIRGACPTNSPELFKHNFFQLMCRQLIPVTEFDKELNRYERDKGVYVNKKGESIISVVDMLEAIYSPSVVSPKARAIRGFDILLRMKERYKSLAKNRRDFSVRPLQSDISVKAEKFAAALKDDQRPYTTLEKSVYTDIDNYKNAFWEHVIHLVYLTAFGTIRQWPEMWEEFLFVKRYLYSEEESKFYDIVKDIEKYIHDLKSNGN